MANKTENESFFQALDAFENLCANIGTSQDKRSHSTYTEKYHFSRATLEAMYAENWLFGKGIDIIPDDMTREWRTLGSSIDPEMTKEFLTFEEDLSVGMKFNTAMKWARLYGGCGIILGIDEAQGGPADTPLELDRLGKDCLTHITVIEAERLTWTGTTVINDPTSPHFDEPEFYYVPGSDQRIHRSRVLPFYGIRLPYYPRRRQRLAYWGAPVIRRVFEAVSNVDMTTGASASLVSEASNDVIKYKGLTAFLASKGGEEKIRSRFALMKLLKSVNNVTLLDEEETFENHQQSFSGLGDLLDRFMAIVAGAFDVPVTRLIGTAAKGLNATGEGDLKNYYDNIRAAQTTDFSPNLRTLDKIMQRSLWGQEQEDWSFTWDSLFQLSEEQLATVENVRADRDQKYINMGVIDELVVAKQLYEDGTYSNIDPEFLDGLEKVVEEAKKFAEGNPGGFPTGPTEPTSNELGDDQGVDPNAPTEDFLEL